MPAIDEVLDELESHSDDINAFVILYIYYRLHLTFLQMK